jgi:hypothetical protein
MGSIYQYGDILRSFLTYSSMSYVCLQYLRTTLELRQLQNKKESIDSIKETKSKPVIDSTIIKNQHSSTVQLMNNHSSTVQLMNNHSSTVQLITSWWQSLTNRKQSIQEPTISHSHKEESEELKLLRSYLKDLEN